MEKTLSWTDYQLSQLIKYVSKNTQVDDAGEGSYYVHMHCKEHGKYERYVYMHICTRNHYVTVSNRGNVHYYRSYFGGYQMYRNREYYKVSPEDIRTIINDFDIAIAKEKAKDLKKKMDIKEQERIAIMSESEDCNEPAPTHDEYGLPI